MKAIILAGGLGSRISEETFLKPKPLVEIGGKPILWHIMKIYSYHGINDFIVLCGYKSDEIKKYFLNFNLINSDFKIDLRTNKKTILNNKFENWKVSIIDTGLNTFTGGRINRIKKYLKPNETFCLTYGDGLADINIKSLINFHKKSKKIATVTIVKPQGKHGSISLSKNGLVNKLSGKEK